jgi:hypothetical protein
MRLFLESDRLGMQRLHGRLFYLQGRDPQVLTFLALLVQQYLLYWYKSDLLHGLLFHK